MSDRDARPRRSSPRAWAVAVALLAGLAMPPGPPAAAGAGHGSIEQMTALAAADSADRLMNAGFDFEALPFIARVEAVAGEVDAGFLMRAAGAEINAGFQVRTVAGLTVPVTRSAVERVHLATRASIRLARAGEISAESEQRSGTIALRARQLTVWGFAREGYAEYRRANQAHRLTSEKLSEVRWLERALRSPGEAPTRDSAP